MSTDPRGYFPDNSFPDARYPFDTPNRHQVGVDKFHCCDGIAVDVPNVCDGTCDCVGCDDEAGSMVSKGGEGQCDKGQDTELRKRARGE